MGRSRPAPPLRMPDGARLTVTRRIGQLSPLERSAARTRSRDSRQTSSGRPTIENDGMPGPTWTSTATGKPEAPRTLADWTVASFRRHHIAVDVLDSRCLQNETDDDYNSTTWAVPYVAYPSYLPPPVVP